MAAICPSPESHLLSPQSDWSAGIASSACLGTSLPVSSSELNKQVLALFRSALGRGGAGRGGDEASLSSSPVAAYLHSSVVGLLEDEAGLDPAAVTRRPGKTGPSLQTRAFTRLGC